MGEITQNTQLNTFTLIRDIIRTDTVLAANFPVTKFHKFFPKLKSTSFSGYPIMEVNVPDADDMQTYLGDDKKEKEFVVTIKMFNEWSARDNVDVLASRIIAALELKASRTTFLGSGYAFQKVDISLSSIPITIDEKDMVTTEFELTLWGEYANG